METAAKVTDLCRSVSSVGSRKSTNCSECQICLSFFEPADISTLPCEHNFCHNCLVKLFLQRDFNCPTCRQEMEPENFNDPNLVAFCRKAHAGAMCFRCDKFVGVDSAAWCAECAAVFCEKCAQTASDPDAVSKTDTQHVQTHRMLPFSLNFGAQLYLQLSQLMMEQMDLAAAEEPDRIAKISTVFMKKLVPPVMEHLEKEIRNNYFKSGANELQQVVFLYSVAFRSAVGADVKLLKFLHNTGLSSDPKPDFSNTDWSKIMKSGEKLNKLIKCLFTFDSFSKDSKALETLFWNKNPTYFDSSRWATNLNRLSSADFRRYAENLVELTSIKAPTYSMLIYDEVLTRNSKSNEDRENPTQSGSSTENLQGASSQPTNSTDMESGFAKLKNLFFGPHRKHGTPEKRRPKTDKKRAQSASPVVHENAGNDSRSQPGQLPSPDNSNGPPLNEDGEPLEFLGEPLSCEGRRMGICEPNVLTDGRVLVCNGVGGIYVFDKTLKLLDLVRVSEVYRDLKFDKAREELLAIEAKEKKEAALKIFDLSFNLQKSIDLPPEMKGGRCLAISEMYLFFLDDKKLFRVPRELIDQQQGTDCVLKMEDVTILVEQTGEDIQFSTFFTHENKLFVGSRIQDEVLVFDLESGKIVKRIHSKQFNRPISPAGICKDEFGNLIVKDLGGIVVFDIETGAFKGLICDIETDVGELTAKDGWLYQTTHQGVLFRWQYCRPELTGHKEDKQFFKGQCEPERKVKN